MIKTYPTLYSKDSLENVRTWYCVQEGHKYYMVSGIKGGAQVPTAPTICEGKNIGRANETSPIQQATAEIEALYKKKLKLKYFKNESDIDKKNFFQPMLAKKFVDYQNKITYPGVVQTKLNGGRCIGVKHGLFSRKGERFLSIPHIIEDLTRVYDEYPQATLDGELFNNDLREKLNKIMSLIRKTKESSITEEDLRESREIIQYHVYDGFLTPDMKGACYLERQQALNEVLSKCTYFRPVKSHVVNSLGMVNHLFEKAINDRQEGLIFRVLKAPYEEKRSKYLLKVKPEDDDEATIIAIHDGTGNWAGAATTCTLRSKKYGEFDATFKGTYEDRAEILKDPKDFLFKEVTYVFMGLTGLINPKTGKGTPNYARVDINNCFKK